MQFIHDGTFHKVARFSGPTHNLLSLRLAVGDHPANPVVERLKPVSNASLDSQTVLSEALAGVDEANQQFGTSYRIAVLQFADGDTPPESIYRRLAFSLVERLATGLPFVVVPAEP